MRRFALLAAVTLVSCSNSDPLNRPRQPEPTPTAVIGFSTYLGDDLPDVARDVAIDSAGNFFVVGGAESTDLLPGAPVAAHAGSEDAFVAKLDPSGQVLWWTFVGGPGPDRGYAIEVDADDNAVIAGGAADGFPVTPGALLTQFQGGAGLGDANDPARDGFVAKLAGADGSLLWATYFGSGTFEVDVDPDPNDNVSDFNDDSDPRTSIVRDIAVDPLTREICLVFSVRGPDVRDPSFVDDGDPNTNDVGPLVRNLPPVILTALQNGAHPELPSLNVGSSGIDGLLAKLSPDGDALAWATYVGGSGDEGVAAAVRLDSQGNPIVLFSTASDVRVTQEDPLTRVAQVTEPITTTGALDTARNGTDLYLAKYTLDGTTLSWATYVGGNDGEALESGHLALRADDAIVIAAMTTSTDIVPIAAPGFDSTFNGASGGSGFFAGDCFVATIGAAGDTLLAVTYYGGAFGDACTGVAVDSRDRIYVTGGTFSPDLPTRNGPIQEDLPGPRSAFLAVFAPDLGQGLADRREGLLHAGYFGGTGTGSSNALLLPPGSDTSTTGRAVFVGGAGPDYPLTPAPGVPARGSVTAPPEHGVITDLTVDLVAS